MCMSLSVCREMYVCRYFKSACLYVSNFYFCISQSVCPRGLYPIVYVCVQCVCTVYFCVFTRAPLVYYRVHIFEYPSWANFFSPTLDCTANFNY